MKKTFSNIAVTIAVFSAASFVGGLFKIPSPVGSIALDSLPGYFASGFYGPYIGAVIGFLGHLASAFSGGFPLGPVNHGIIAATMFVWCLGFGFIIRKYPGIRGCIVATAFATLGNGLGSIYVLVALGKLPQETALAITPFVLFASFLNSFIAAAGIYLLSRRRKAKSDQE